MAENNVYTQTYGVPWPQASEIITINIFHMICQTCFLTSICNIHVVEYWLIYLYICLYISKVDSWHVLDMHIRDINSKNCHCLNSLKQNLYFYYRTWKKLFQPTTHIIVLSLLREFRVFLCEKFIRNDISVINQFGKSEKN